jgi:hypothetical protein
MLRAVPYRNRQLVDQAVGCQPRRTAVRFWPCEKRTARLKCRSSRVFGVFETCLRKQGKYHRAGARPLRNLLLAVVLIAAAFAGGAVVSGPGRGWIQGILSQIRPRGPALVTTSDGVAPKANDGEPASDPIPAAPAPPLVVGPVLEELPQKNGAGSLRGDTAAASTPGQASTPAGDLGFPGAGALGRADPVTLSASGHENPAAGAGPTAARTPGASGSRPDQDRGWSDAPGSAPAAAVLPQRVASESSTKGDSALLRASLPGSPLGGAGDAATAESNKGGQASSGSMTWGDLRSRMRALGVTQYWIEGEPDGHVRFRCVTSFVGQRAVAHYFEAEGDDVLSAGESALTRVMLWQATELP